MPADLSKKLLALKKKLQMWKRKIKFQKTILFSVFHQFVIDMKEVRLDDVNIVIKRHLA